MKPSARFRGKLGSALALCLFGGTTVMLASTVAAGFEPAVRAKLGWAPVETVAYARGSTTDLPASVYRNQPRTLFVVASATCGASLRSAQALSSLASEFRDSGTAMVVVTPDEMNADQQAFVRGLGLRPSEHMSMNVKGLRLEYIPAVILVNSSGRVLYSRDGVIDDAGKQSVSQAVRESLR